MDKLGKYLEDRNFINWVFHPDGGLEEWWDQYKIDNPEEVNILQLARSILLKFRTQDKNLSEEDKIVLFSKVLRQIEEKQKNKETLRFIAIFSKYAAVALIFFSIGALLFYKKNHFNPQIYSQNITQEVFDNPARIIRSNGENIILNDTKSIIEYRPDGKILINNDTIKLEEAEKNKEIGLNHIIMPFGKTSELLLPDGTKVYLNAGSRFIYPEFFGKGNREVFLVGEAFFEVKHDKKHPFIVQTTDIRIKVLGTQFNVSAYPSDNIIETVLTEGKVRLEQNNSGLFTETTELKPNQLALFNKTNKKTKLMIVDTDNYTLWKDGMFKFESTDLSRIVKKLERYYNIRFQYKNPLLGSLKISGKLELKENKDEIIDRVASAASIKIIKKRENHYEISL